MFEKNYFQRQENHFVKPSLMALFFYTNIVIYDPYLTRLGKKI